MPSKHERGNGCNQLVDSKCQNNASTGVNCPIMHIEYDLTGSGLGGGEMRAEPLLFLM